LSRFLKHKVKSSANFIFQFEGNLAAYCKKRGFDGVICGHIHHAEIRDIDGITYMNDGDWVESMTALVEHHSGKWEIITWNRERDSVDLDTDSSTHERSPGHSGTSGDTISRSEKLPAGPELDVVVHKV
jgi:hypothetical protein